MAVRRFRVPAWPLLLGVALAILAGVAGVAKVWQGSRELLRLAEEHAHRERDWLEVADSQYAALGEVPNPDRAQEAGALTRQQVARQYELAVQMVAYHAALKRKYARAAVRPWQRVAPDPPPPHPYLRARYWLTRNRFDDAIASYDDAIRIDPDDHAAFAARAWLWATWPEAGHRNGARAVESARRACELTAWKSASYLDTLAAAYAESGKFTEAANWEQQAIEHLPPQSETEAEYRQRLALYERGQPFRETVERTSTASPALAE